jgi:CRISP-associated protein Cas1
MMGLEPYIGFIHTTHTNKAPRIYDLQEPFRWIVGKAILKIIHEKKLSKKDFMTSDEGNTMLKPSAVRVVLDEISLQFRHMVSYKGMKREWQTMIMLKTRELTRLF